VDATAATSAGGRWHARVGMGDSLCDLHSRPGFRATPGGDVPSKPVKVLFAEDEDLVRLMMADVLREEAFQPSCVS
jgi:hypothetical protein